LAEFREEGLVMQRLHTLAYLIWLFIGAMFILTNWPLMLVTATLGIVGLQAVVPIVQVVVITAFVALTLQFLLGLGMAFVQQRRIRSLQNELTRARAALPDAVEQRTVLTESRPTLATTPTDTVVERREVIEEQTPRPPLRIAR